MIVSTSRLTYIRASNTYIGEVSEVGRDGNQPHRLYPDAADVGLTLVNNQTGHGATFVMDLEPKRDNSGDIVSWGFSATTETARKYPQLANTRIEIFND